MQRKLPPTKKILFYLSFVCLNLLLSFYFADIWLTPNPVSRALPVLTLQENNTLVIDKYEKFTGDKSKIKNHFYSDKAPLSSFLVYPAYSLYKKLNFHELPDTVFKKYPIYIWEHVGMPDGRAFLLPKTGVILLLGDFITGTLPFVLMLLLTLISVRETGPGKSHIPLIMLAFYGTFLFVYAGTFNGHLLAGFFLLASYFFLTRKTWYFLAGISVGLAFATEYPLAAIIPVWALQILIKEKGFKKSLLFVAGIIPGAAIVLLYNKAITGSAFQTAYSYVAHEEYKDIGNLGFGTPSVKAIWGLLFSKFRGMLFYAPILALMLIYLIGRKREAISNFFKGNRLPYLKFLANNYLLSAVLVFIILFSAHRVWYGGWAYGPRHLIPLTSLLLFEGVYFLAKYKYSNLAVYVFGGTGLICAWLAKSTRVFMMPYNEKANEFSNPISEVVVPDFNEDKLNANNLFTLFGDVDPKLASMLWLVFFMVICVILRQFYFRIYPEKILIRTAPEIAKQKTASIPTPTINKNKKQKKGK